jgi:hypothetical protein
MWILFVGAALAGKFEVGVPTLVPGVKAVSEATVRVASGDVKDGKLVEHCDINIDAVRTGWVEIADVTCKAAFEGIPADPAFVATEGKLYRIDLGEQVGNTAADGSRMDTATWRRFHEQSPAARVGTLQSNEALHGKWRKGQVVADTSWVIPTFLPTLPPNDRDGLIVQGRFDGLPYRAPLGKFVFDIEFPVGTMTITVMVDKQGRVWREDVVSDGVPAYDLKWSRSINWADEAPSR